MNKATGIDSVIEVAQKLLTVLIVIGSVGLSLATPWLSYRDGLGGGRNIFSAVCALWLPFLWMLVFFLLLCQFALVVATICKYGLKHSGLFLGLFSFCIITSCTFWCYSISNPTFVSFSKGFRDKMKCDVNVGEIQKWLKTIEKPKEPVKYIIDPYGPPNISVLVAPEATYIKSLDSLNWPKTICNLQPKMVYIQLYDNDEAIIRLQWGGTFGSWGILVGPPDMEVPESDMKRGGEYRLKLAPGAYVWHDIR
jgi:hypothetical protein